MAETMTQGKGKSVTLATTVTRLNGVARLRTICLFRSTGASIIYVVTDGTPDGNAVPADGRMAIPAAALPIELDVSGYGSVGLAGDVTGTVEAMLS